LPETISFHQSHHGHHREPQIITTPESHGSSSNQLDQGDICPNLTRESSADELSDHSISNLSSTETVLCHQKENRLEIANDSDSFDIPSPSPIEEVTSYDFGSGNTSVPPFQVVNHNGLFTTSFVISLVLLTLQGLPTIPEHGFYRLRLAYNLSSWKNVEPTIKTAENAAAAKIALETMYSQLLSNDIGAGLAKSARLGNNSRSNLLQNITLINHSKGEQPSHLRVVRALKTRILASYAGSLKIGPYEKMRIIGKGSFGSVQLVRRKEPVVSSGLMANKEIDVAENDTDGTSLGSAILHNKVYAMKIIHKSEMLRKSQEAHLRAERDFLVAAEKSRWVVPLFESFQDNENLYLVMEYMVGGDFLTLLLRWDIVPEELAKFYLAEMLLAVEEVHNMGWIHRDIKPDNFLISASGHLKISDFGLAFDGHWSHHQRYFNETRHQITRDLNIEIRGDYDDVEDFQTGKTPMLRYADGDRPGRHLVIDKLGPSYNRRLAKTIVGTSQYMAPEIVAGQPYDGRCDFWSIGIILFEVGDVCCRYGLC
jgi:tRNA A-37 threonylcarbamoyl transferase component Bud32